MVSFLLIAVPLTLVAVALVAVPLLRQREDAAPVTAVTLALLIPSGVLAAYLAASNYDWINPAQPAPAAAQGNPRPLEEAVASLEARLARAPDDEQGWLLLGSSYANLRRPTEAIRAYERALSLSGGNNPEAKLGLAEASFLVDQTSLTGRAGDLVEEVVAAQPGNTKALWYGGLVALARNEPDLARERWQALLSLSPPEQIRQIVETQLAQIGGAAAVAAPGAAAASSEAIEVEVSLEPGLAAQVRPGAALFVAVREAGQQGGPPLAVYRGSAAALPARIRLTDANVMLPGRSLAGITGARINARVANAGDALARPGDIFGEADWTSEEGGAVSVVLDRIVGQ